MVKMFVNHVNKDMYYQVMAYPVYQQVLSYKNMINFVMIMYIQLSVEYVHLVIIKKMMYV